MVFDYRFEGHQVDSRVLVAPYEIGTQKQKFRHVSTPEDLRTQASLNFRSCMENFVCSMVITSDQADPVAVDLDNTRFCPELTGPA